MMARISRHDHANAVSSSVVDIAVSTRPSYDMLPEASASRQQYEAALPSEWQIVLLPFQIAAYEQRLEEIAESGRLLRQRVPESEALYRRLDRQPTDVMSEIETARHKHAVREALDRWHADEAALSDALKAYARIQALLEADRQRYAEGLEQREAVRK